MTAFQADGNDSISLCRSNYKGKGMDILRTAWLVSFTAHNAVGQKRKYTGDPYWTHPEAVANILLKHSSMLVTDEMLAAAYLHDVIEDTSITKNQLEHIFGEQVANLVDELTDKYTDPAVGNRATRKELERKRLSTISAEAQTIKYADLIHNTESIVQYDKDFSRVYLKEKKRILEVMDRGDSSLREFAINQTNYWIDVLSKE